MVVTCAVGNCGNSSDNCKSFNISFHSFPKDSVRKKLWLEALGKSEDWEPNFSLKVCSIHFKKEDFIINKKSYQKTKVPRVKRINLDAIPSFLDPNLFSKLKEETVLNPTPSYEPIPDNFHNYAKASTVASGSEECGINLPIETSYSSESSDESEMEYDPEAISIGSLPFITSGSIFSQQGDFTFEPSQSTEESSDEMDHEGKFDEFPEPKEPHLEDKYIVFASNLLLLFKMCHICHKQPVVQINRRVVGLFLLVKTECLGGCEFEWKSQPHFGNTSYGNYLLAACIYFSGLLPTKCLNALMHFKLKIFSIRMYFNYQRMFHPVIEKVWKNKQDILLNDVKQKQNLVLCGDGRADSPGFSAKYGTYVFLEPESKMILHTELVQSTEVSNSNQMELEGLERGLCFFEKNKVRIHKIVTDRNKRIIAFLRKYHQKIVHEFDNWHVAKNINSKLKKVSKKKGNEKLEIWLKAIVNHVYWVASSSKSPEERKAKWTSLLNHICNIHEGHSPYYPKCCHEPISEGDDRMWLNPGSDLFMHVSSVINSPYTLAAVSQLSNDYQTYAVDVFNSVVNSFCPKQINFHNDSMKSRTFLACLHYNENVKKTHKEDQYGEKRYFLAFPRRKHRISTDKKILEDCTYGYVEELLQITFEMAEQNKMVEIQIEPLCQIETFAFKH